MGDGFFDAFDGEINVDWSKISESDLDQMIAKLDDQDADKLFDDLKAAIETNNRNKAIVKTTLAALQTAVKLGMKVI